MAKFKKNGSNSQSYFYKIKGNTLAITDAIEFR